ncbi:MAG: AAA family ATPase [Acidimicrobiales bacterium]
MQSPLTEPVETFIAGLVPVLIDLARDSGLPAPDKLRDDVALEAFNLAAALIDADGVHTDSELWAFVAVFAGRFETVAWAASPSTLRNTGLLTGKRTFVDTPSTMLSLLIQADLRNGTTHSWSYFHDALDIARAVCALDQQPTHAELMAVERFRSMLLRTMDHAGMPRPGTTPPTARRPAPASPPGAGPETPAATAPPLPPPRDLDELMEELDGLVGLAAVKAEVKLVTNLMRVEKLRTERGLPTVEHSRHLVFTGNPGTGKTTVARLLAEIYRTLGVVEKGHLVETDRAGLVAGYIGQTAIKVRDVFTSALGGVLLIDEAHALARSTSGSDFGHEAIDAIVKLMEDHRDEVVLVVAGYPAEMATFLDANPGLRSRFPKTIYFEDYSNDELVRIFRGICAKASYTPTEGACASVAAYVAAQPRNQGFGNARLVRNLFEAAVANQASRVVTLVDVTDEALVTLEAGDVPAA